MLGMSSLFIPASAPRMINSGISFITDSIILDLEDAVNLSEKDAARDMLRYALPLFAGKTIAIRINSFDSCWLDDIEALGHFNVDTIVAPKADEEFVCALSDVLDKMSVKSNIALLIETAASLEKTESIAKASKRVTSILLGAEDYCFDMGTERSASGEEIFYARNKVATAAKALSLEALDTPFTNVNDTDGLLADACLAKKLGFTGKLAINPLQVETIQKVFKPTLAEIQWAKRVVTASQAHENKGKGAFSLDSKMIDMPIIKRAANVLARCALEVDSL